jgi:transcription-repair coupling factor (superfamily II helicase)
MAISFVPNAPIDPKRLIALLQKERGLRLAGPERLRIEQKTATLDARVQVLRNVFKALASPTAPATTH